MNRAQLKELVKNIMSEESEYQAFFQKALDKAGKSIPSMSDDEKKAFFNKIDSAWDGKGEKNEALVGGQKKLDVDGDGEIEASDLADLRAGKKADEGMELPKATIPSTVKSKLDMAIDKIKDSDLTYNQKVQVVGQVMDSLGIDKAEFNKMASKLKGTMESVNESKESDINAKIDKLLSDAEAGKIKTFDEFLDKFYPLQKQLKSLRKESINESLTANDGKILLNGKPVGYYDYDRDSAAFWTTDLSDKQFRGSQAFDTKEEMLAFFKKYLSRAAKALEYQRKALAKFGIKYPADESVNEGVSSTDMDKIKGAVEAANSFMSVGAELKKLGMKYTFATEPLPIYIIQPTPNNKVAIVNKKYATKPDFVVGDIAVGIMESKSPKSVNEQYTWKQIDRTCALISNFAQVEKRDVKRFIEDNNLDMEKIYKDVSTSTPVGRMLLNKVINDTPNSQIQKNYIRRFALKDGKLTEGRAFINAARKAKNEGLTEFEFNGKKYPVTIKD
jgi:hypothetical protein